LPDICLISLICWLPSPQEAFSPGHQALQLAGLILFFKKRPKKYRFWKKIPYFPDYFIFCLFYIRTKNSQGVENAGKSRKSLNG
jgi:hypothetical protein